VKNFKRRLKAKQNVITVNKKVDVSTWLIELFAVTNELHVRSLKVIAGSITA